MSKIIDIRVKDSRTKTQGTKKLTYYIIETLINGKQTTSIEKRFSEFSSNYKLWIQILPKEKRKLIPKMPSKSLFTTDDKTKEENILRICSTFPALILSDYFQHFIGVKGFLDKTIVVEHIKESRKNKSSYVFPDNKENSFRSQTLEVKKPRKQSFETLKQTEERLDLLTRDLAEKTTKLFERELEVLNEKKKIEGERKEMIEEMKKVEEEKEKLKEDIQKERDEIQEERVKIEEKNKELKNLLELVRGEQLEIAEEKMKMKKERDEFEILKKEVKKKLKTLREKIEKEKKEKDEKNR